MVCNRAFGVPFSLPTHPELPDFRVQRSRPFLNTGLDFAGPFSTRERFVDKTFFDYKSYLLVFTCAASRAVHFEATNSLNVYDFRLAFQRFISDRGVPELLVSDNALTFVSENKRLQAIYRSPEVRSYMRGMRVDWQFYTKKAP